MIDLGFFKRIRFNLFSGLTTSAGGVIIAYLFTVLPKGAAILLAIIYIVALIIFFIERERMKASIEDKEAMRKEMEDKERAEYTIFLKNSRDDFTWLLSERINEIRRLNVALSNLFRQKNASSPNLLDTFQSLGYPRDLKVRLATMALQRICGLFNRSIQSMPIEKENFFKATLFEVQEKGGKEILVRSPYFHYPRGMNPHTAEIDPDKHPRATAVLSWKQDQIIIIEDIEEEWSKPARERRWEDLRDDHHEEYGSIVCMPIVAGPPEPLVRKTIGVITIDTNIKRYFKDNRDYQTFLGNLITPYRLFIAQLYTCQECLDRITHFPNMPKEKGS